MVWHTPVVYSPHASYCPRNFINFSELCHCSIPFAGIRFDSAQNASLRITVELAPGIEPSGERQQAIAASIRHHLCRLNSEFANYVPEHYQMPQISLLQTGDPEYFPMGVKHRYTRSSVSNSV
jgi:hypothetical protein